MKVNYEI